MTQFAEYECTVSFTYTEASPEQAALDFINNLRHADWYINVRNLDNNKTWLVDTKTLEAEPLHD